MNASIQEIPESIRLDRRQFLGSLGGLVLVASLTDVVKAQDAPKYGAEGMPHGTVDDPLTFVAMPLILVITAVVATWVPATVASRADPATTLRSE